MHRTPLRWIAALTRVASPLFAQTPAPIAPAAPSADATADEQRTAAGSLNELGLDLYGRLRARAGNLAIAPASIALAFGMTEAGARGETLAEMRRVLHSTLAPARQAVALGALSRRWNGPLGDEVTVRSANRLFGHTAYTFDAGFVARSGALFAAPLERVDFAQSEPAREHINGWVATQTNDRIRDLLPSGAIDRNTRLVLTNAMYLRAAWQTPFVAAATRDEPFYANGTTEVPVPTMHATGSYAHAQLAGYQAVELLYRGGQLSMVLLVPDARDGLARLEGQLSAAQLGRTFDALAPAQVRLSIPRVRVAGGSLALRATLEALGMRAPFDAARADFTGIAAPRDPADRLRISEAFHKVFVDVNETGTEAAAATAVVMGRGGAMRVSEPRVLTVDRPYLFVVRDRANGAVLFLGRVVDPRAAT